MTFNILDIQEDSIQNAKELLRIAKYEIYLIKNSLEAQIAFQASPFIISYNIKEIKKKQELCKALEIYDKSFKDKDLFQLIPLWILNKNIQDEGPILLKTYKENVNILCFYLLYNILLSSNLKEINLEDKEDILYLLDHIENKSFINQKEDKNNIYTHARTWMNRRLLDIYHSSF